MPGAEDARRILELRVEAPERRTEKEDDKGCVVQRQDDGDWKSPISEPVGRCQPNRLQPTRLTADRAVLEERGPGERKGPGRQHVGYDQRGREPAAPEHIRPADEPGEHGADHEGQQNGAHRHRERIEKRAPEQVCRHRRKQHPVEVVERELADILAQAPLVPELDPGRIEHDGNDRYDDQIGEQQCSQHAYECRGFP